MVFGSQSGWKGNARYARAMRAGTCAPGSAQSRYGWRARSKHAVLKRVTTLNSQYCDSRPCVAIDSLWRTRVKFTRFIQNEQECAWYIPLLIMLPARVIPDLHIRTFMFLSEPKLAYMHNENSLQH